MASRLTLFGVLVSLGLCLSASSLPASTGCPGGVLFEPDPTGSTVDAGWSGLAHGMPVAGYALRMNLSCAASVPPCGMCSITGLEANAGGNNQRCTNDTSIRCTVATEGTDCGGPDRCRFFASPPSPIATGGVSTCYTSEVIGPVSGTVDVDTGALAPNVPLQVQLYSGFTDNPCVRCVGDATPNDNVRGGVCDDGPRVGLSCDGNAVAEYPDFGVTSFDCPKGTEQKIADFVLGTVSLSTATQTRVISAASPACGDGSGRRCFCDTCNNGLNQACAQDSDCPNPPGPIDGICGGRRCLLGTNAGAACNLNSECQSGFCYRTGEPSKPNSCIDDTSTPGQDCTDTNPVDGEGECVFGPTSKYCSIASGHPQRSCTTNTDCGGAPGSCVARNRPCYPDGGVIGGEVSVSGVATPPAGNSSDPTAIAALTCVAPTRTDAVNTAGGFPGLARMFYPGRAVFAEKMVVEVAPPGGTVTTVGSGSPSVVETSVTTPTGGEVQIVGSFNAGTPPSGYEFVGRLVQIDAQPATAASPLRISFDIAGSEIPVGQNQNTVAVFRDGVGPIPDCLGSTQAIPDDPCITARTPLGGGAARITVLTSHASEWTLATPPAVPFCPSSVDLGCRSPIVSRKSSLLLVDKTPSDKDQIQWKWLAGAATTVGEIGNPDTTDAYGLCIYNPLGLTSSTYIPEGGMCAGKPCWKAKPTGFQYKNKDLAANPVTQLSLKAGLDGKAQIQLKGKGSQLAMPVVGSTITVQLRNLATSQCWTASYSAPFDKYDGVTLKDKAD